MYYDLRSNNCEHYVNQWKYGIGWSSQVNTIVSLFGVPINITAFGALYAFNARTMAILETYLYLNHNMLIKMLKNVLKSELKDALVRGSIYSHWVFFEKIDSNGNVLCYHVTITDPRQTRFNTNALIINYYFFTLITIFIVL